MQKAKLIIVTAACTAAITDGAPMLYFGNSLSAIIKFGNVLKIMEDKFYFDYDDEKALDYALSGLTIASDDKYTNYYSKEKYKSYVADGRNTYIGIGIVLGPADNEDVLKIYSVSDNSPAKEAGLETGDLILKINGEAMSSQDVQRAAELIRDGNGKTEIMLKRDNKEFTVSVEKKSIGKNSVTSRILDDSTGYIKISAFDRKDNTDKESIDTYDEFKLEADKLYSEGYKNLVIDLRNNPGGDVQVVTEIADYLMPEGVITYFEDKSGKRKYFNSDKEFKDFNIVVLVNGYSASASELLSGALKDSGRAKIVGTKTYGKGIVQDVYSFSDGYGMSVTTARYYTPSGKCIHEIGIEPDVYVEQTKEDIQLEKALELFEK